MSTTTRQTNVPLWHFQCPDCGMGDGEMGHHAQTHVIYCEVCLEEDKHVRLKRWPVDDVSGPLADGGPGGG